MSSALRPVWTFALGTIAGLVFSRDTIKYVLKTAVRGVVGIKDGLTTITAEVMEEIEDEQAAKQDRTTQRPASKPSSKT